MPATQTLKGIHLRINDKNRIVPSGPLAPDKISYYATGAAETVLLTYQQWTSDDGSGPINPRIRVRVEPDGIYLDMLGDFVDQGPYLQYQVHKYSQQAFRDKCLEAISASIHKWSRKEYGQIMYADQERVWADTR